MTIFVQVTDKKQLIACPRGQGTVECHYNMVQHNMIFHMVSQWLRWNMHQRLYSQKTPHILSSWVSCGMSSVRIWVIIYCIITVPPCMFWVLLIIYTLLVCHAVLPWYIDSELNRNILVVRVMLVFCIFTIHQINFFTINSLRHEQNCHWFTDVI